MSDPLEVYEHDPSVARRLMVMAHWRLTPKQVRELQPSDLDLMEFAFLVQERRQVESLDGLFGSLLGTNWDVDTLLPDGKEEVVESGLIQWSLRKKKPKVFLPLTLVVNQSPKFVEHLRKLASGVKLHRRASQSVIDAPDWLSKVKQEDIVDLSNAPKDVFLKFAGRYKLLAQE